MANHSDVDENDGQDRPDEGPNEQAIELEMPKDVEQAVVSLSGGMDSTALLMHLLARDVKVYALSFDYGQKHKLELERLQANLAYLAEHSIEVTHDIVDISVLGNLYNSALTTADWEVPEGFYEQANMKETVVPNRNAIFSSMVYGYALSIAGKTDRPVAMALGVHSGDHAIYPDCRPAFYQALMGAFAAGNWEAERVKLFLPYLHGDKLTILRDAEQTIARLGLDFDTIFANTCTSYHPDAEGRAGGKSGADVERILAFYQLGRRDPIEYVAPWEEVLAAAIKVEESAMRD